MKRTGSHHQEKCKCTKATTTAAPMARFSTRSNQTGNRVMALLRRCLKGEPHGLACAAVPGRPVPRQDPGRVEFAKAGDGGHGLLGFERERRGLGAGHASEYVAGRHGVADEEGV